MEGPPALDERDGERDSSMSISISVSVGYQRRRPNYHGDRAEARLEGLGLLLAGAAVVLLALFFLIPKILSLL